MGQSSLRADWLSWRGPDGMGSADYDAPPPVSWSPDDAAWSMALPGKGGSTPIVRGDTVYLTTPMEGQDAIVAISLSDGTLRWSRELGPLSPARHRQLGSSCNASPVIDGERLYFAFRSGRIGALNFEGEVMWQHDLNEEFGPEDRYWDAGSSPVVTGDIVMFTRLHGGASWIAAYDKHTGVRRWLTPRDFDVPTENDHGYTTPIVFEVGKQHSALIWAADHLSAYSIEDGAPRWHLDGFNPNNQNYWPAIACPVILGDTVVVPVGRDDRARQSSIHGVALQENAMPERVWTREDIGVFVASLAGYKGRVYLLRDRGGIVCLNAESGETYWEAKLPRERFSYYASPTIANGVLFAARQDGAVFSVRIGESFELLSENRMKEPIIASPVPVNGGLLIRGDKNLFLFTRSE